MKVIQFTVPVANEGSVVVQEDILPYFYNYFHRHKEIQITLIIKGEGTLIAGNYTQPFKANEVYVMGPDQPHMFKGDARYFENLEEKNIHAIHIFFDHNNLNHFFNIPELQFIKKFTTDALGSLQLPSHHVPQISKQIIQISKCVDFERLINFVYLIQSFSTNVTDWRSLSTGFSKYSYSDTEGIRMNDIYQYTIENYSEHITLGKIAFIANMTPHAFCKYFKKHTRKTYLSFLNEIRINEACKSILKGNIGSISTVAYSTGFNSAITFNRVFKKIVGMPPSDYLKKKRVKNLSSELE